MAHPTRTGDLVVFAYPPYQFDAATPGTLVARSAFFGQHGYVPDVQNLADNINMRATFLAGGERIAKGRFEVRIDRHRADDRLPAGRPEPQQAQGRVLLDVLKGGRRVKPLTIIGLNDFHGQLDPTTMTDGRHQHHASAARAQLATLFDEDAASLPGPALLLAGGRQRRRLAAELRPARGQAGHRRGERLGPGRDVLRQPRVRLRRRAPARRIRRAPNFPFLATNIVDTATGEAPTGSRRPTVFTRQRRQGRRDRRRRWRTPRNWCRPAPPTG